MLHLITGTDRNAISDYLMQLVSSEVLLKRDGQILIVPEQFSHETERRLCNTCGDTASRFAEVFSLSRMADRIAGEYGGIARSYLDHGGRVLAMALAAEQVSSRIKLYAAMIRRPEFLVNLISMVDEFQSYGMEPKRLFEASADAEGQFAQKLEELGLLYEAYLAICANGSADPAGKLLWLRDILHEKLWAANKSFYIDGFTDFTGVELSVLEGLLRQSDHVWITITVPSGKTAASRPAVGTIKRLKRLAAKWEIPFDEHIVPKDGSKSQAVDDLLSGLFSAEDQRSIESDLIMLRSFQTVEEECRHAVVHIRHLLMNGARCRDIAVSCTDTELYDAPLRASLGMIGIPAYYAGRELLLGKPVIYSVLSALQTAIGSLDYEDMAEYLKSGLTCLERDRCDRLDCYAYMWKLRGSQWLQPLELHPRGFGIEWTEDDRELLEQLNNDKDCAFLPLFRLREALFAADNTGEMVLAVYHFLEELELDKRLEEQANRLGGQTGQELVQIFELLCQSLEQTWFILQNSVRSADDFVKLYRTVLTQYHVGTIPAGVDQIYVGSLQDLRSKRVRHLLVLGGSDGNFPSYKTGSGLLTEEERLYLRARGVELAPDQADQMDREMSQIYGALSAATESMWLSYAGDQPSWLYRRACALFPASAQENHEDIFLDIPSFAAWRLRHHNCTPLDLPELDRWESSLRSLREYSFSPLGKETVKGLYGSQLYLSASRIDKYASCRFAFFLSYGLKAKPRKQATLDPSAFGTFVHAVLQNVVERVVDDGGFRTVSEERLLEIALEEIDQYVAMFFPKQANREAYLFQRSRNEILDIVRDLGEELRNSKFDPVSCELEFSDSGQLPSVEIQGNDTSCKVSGFVDRVDLFEENGETYVRVVDYKTGRKDFDFTDILNGAGLQMLIYLFALKDAGGSYYGKNSLLPAGILYLPARKEYTLTKPMPDDSDVALRHQDERRRRGLIVNDPAVLAAMESDPKNPRFMPYQMEKGSISGHIADPWQMQLLENHVLRTLSNMADQIASGVVKPNPIRRGQDSSCRFCDYQTICHMDLCSRETRLMAATSAEKFWNKLNQEEAENGRD